MAKVKTVTKNELDGDVALARPANELDQLTFQEPLMRVVQQQLGPFVAHRHECEGDPCSCGLAAALAELQRREVLVKRYGIVDA